MNKPLTNGERIRAMTDDQLADFIESLAFARSTPWSDAFEAAFCRSCPSVRVTLEDHYFPMDVHECDFSDGTCPHGNDILWWLSQTHEEGGAGRA